MGIQGATAHLFFGRRYIVSDRPSAWLLGLASHLTNSVLLTFVWATTIAPNLSSPRPLNGLLWGDALALVLSGGLLAPMSGLGIMGRRTGNYRFALTSLLLHALWGVLIGLIYVP